MLSNTNIQIYFDKAKKKIVFYQKASCIARGFLFVIIKRKTPVSPSLQ